LDNSKDDEIRLKRFDIISPLLDRTLDHPSLCKKTREVADEYGLSEKTIQRYLAKYKENGLKGLSSLKGGKKGSQVIPHDLLIQIMHMRREVPSRSVQKIIRCLELEETIEEGTIKRSTLQKQLYSNYCGRSHLKQQNDPNAAGGMRFQRNHRNDLWQSDSKHGSIICGKKTYLITFIDDCTRLILHSEFYFTEAAESIADCLRKAIEKYGIPNSIYVDNGTPYVSRSLTRTCGKLGINKLHTQVGIAKSKGYVKILIM
jgi:transposase InsO family protein